MITRGTAPGATRFITATTTIEVETRAAELTATAADITATGAGIVPAAMKGTGRQMGTPEGAAELTVIAAELVFATTKGTGPPMRTPAAAAGLKTVPAQQPGLLKETITLLEDTLNPAVRAAFARAPSATTTMADRKGAFRHAEAPASAAEERVAAVRVAEVVADTDNRSFVGFLIHREI